MAIQSFDNLIKGLAASGASPFYKGSLSAQLAGVFGSGYRASGVPTQGTIPTTAAIPTKNDPGCFKLPTIGAGESIYLARVDLTAANISNWVIADRLAHMGGMSGVVTTAQTADLSIATPAADGRCDVTGEDVDWFLEWYTATGATAVTATVAYTDANDQAQTTTVSLPASVGAGRLYQILPSTSAAIKSIQSVTLSATTATAGNFGVTAYKRYCGFTVPVANTGVVLDFGGTGLPIIPPNAYIQFITLCTTTTSGIILGTLNFAVG